MVMCGKFTAMASWREVHAFSQPLTANSGAGSNDEVVTYTPGRDLPMIVFDRETRQRRVEPMRWAFPNLATHTICLFTHVRKASTPRTLSHKPFETASAVS